MMACFHSDRLANEEAPIGLTPVPEQLLLKVALPEKLTFQATSCRQVEAVDVPPEYVTVVLGKTKAPRIVVPELPLKLLAEVLEGVLGS